MSIFAEAEPVLLAIVDAPAARQIATELFEIASSEHAQSCRRRQMQEVFYIAWATLQANRECGCAVRRH